MDQGIQEICYEMAQQINDIDQVRTCPELAIFYWARVSHAVQLVAVSQYGLRLLYESKSIHSV